MCSGGGGGGFGDRSIPGGASLQMSACPFDLALLDQNICAANLSSIQLVCASRRPRGLAPNSPAVSVREINIEIVVIGA